MTKTHRRRLIAALFVVLFGVASFISQQDLSSVMPSTVPASEKAQSVLTTLNSLAVKGRAPKTGYTRAQFGDGWRQNDGCDTRNIILARDLAGERVDDDCEVLSGELNDPYTGKVIHFKRGPNTSDDVQIDHVVALSDAWQKGAQQLTRLSRENLANDPLNLLAVDGPANQQKSDGDAATWLPSNKAFRCQYVSRQVGVKAKYHLWVTTAERNAIQQVLSRC